MKNLKTSAAVISMGLLAVGCTQTGNIERNAAGGAAAGALVGAIIGNNVGDGDAETGAIIGAVVGGAAGAQRGRDMDQRQQGQQQLYFDQRAQRHYYVDQYGNTYWQNGERRS